MSNCTQTVLCSIDCIYLPFFFYFTHLLQHKSVLCYTDKEIQNLSNFPSFIIYYGNNAMQNTHRISLISYVRKTYSEGTQTNAGGMLIPGENGVSFPENWTPPAILLHFNTLELPTSFG